MSRISTSREFLIIIFWGGGGSGETLDGDGRACNNLLKSIMEAHNTRKRYFSVISSLKEAASSGL